MDRMIHCKVKLNCSRRQAFEMFTKNAHIQTWLAQIAEVEPYAGGKYELFWDAENREINSTMGCKVTAIEADQLLCFEWKGPAQFAHFMNAADPLTHVSVFFSPISDGENATEIHLVHTGWRSDDDWERAREWFEGVWENALASLRTAADPACQSPC